MILTLIQKKICFLISRSFDPKKIQSMNFDEELEVFDKRGW